MANPKLTVEAEARFGKFERSVEKAMGSVGALGQKISRVSKTSRADLEKMSASLKSAGDRMTSIGQKMSVGLTLPIVSAGVASVKFASDFEENLNKVDVAFGASSQAVKDFAKTTNEQFGIAELDALNMAGLFGDLATAMGIPTKEASNMAQTLVGLTGDLASFKNVSTEQAQLALSGIFTGESEALKTLGIIITETALAQEARNMGIEKSIKNMTQEEKIMVRLSAVMRQTENAQGDFNRTSDGTANLLRSLQGSLKQVSAEFGKIMQPAVNAVLKSMQGFVKVLKLLPDSAKSVIIVIAGITAVIGPLLIGLGAMSTLVGTILTPAFLAGASAVASFATAMAVVLAKVIAVVAVIGALAIGVVYVVRNFQSFANLVKTVLLAVFHNLMMAFKGLVDMVKSGLEFAGLTKQAEKVQQFSDDIAGYMDTIKSKGEDAQDGIDFEGMDETFGAIGGAVKGVAKNIGFMADETKRAEQNVNALADAQRNFEKGQGVGRKDVEAQSLGGGQISDQAPRFGMVAVPTFGDIGLSFDLFKKKMSQVTMITGNFATGFDAQLNKAVVGAKRLTGFLRNELANAITSSAEILGNMLTGDADVADFFDNILKSVANFAIKFGKLAVAMGVAALEIKQSLLANPALAIAGGIALIALGSAMKNLVSDGPAKMKDGGIVPSGFPNDTYPAMLTSGEMVVPKPQALPGNLGGGAVEVFGEFRVSGSDLVTAINNTNSRTLR